jgi:D-alanyl-D-alanine carboxypeptidase-like protein
MAASPSLALAVALIVLGGSSPAPEPKREQPAANAGPPRFEGASSPLDPATRERIKGSSWHPGCPVGLDDLRFLRLTYWGFDREAHSGRLVVHKSVAGPVLKAMRSLYRHRFPIRRMRLVDAYGADDHRSMDADNTSAFNCRFIAGQPGVWSQHAYGKAIDVNPIENPYVTGSGFVSPPAGSPFADRSRGGAGMIHRGDPTERAFAAIGWGWGGRWSWPKDYQHFSANGH